MRPVLRAVIDALPAALAIAFVIHMANHVIAGLVAASWGVAS